MTRIWKRGYIPKIPILTKNKLCYNEYIGSYLLITI